MEHRIKSVLKALYEGNSLEAHRFRYALLCADIAAVVFIAVSSFVDRGPVITLIDILFGAYLLVDYGARFLIALRKVPFMCNPLNIADFVSMVSFLAPYFGVHFGFLRAIRVMRLLRSYRLLSKLREDFPIFQKREDIIVSATNLVVFIFIMTELVYQDQKSINPKIQSFLDAMYFTVTTLTTTGFGDITLVGESGRAISIVVMIFGVSLFLRLIQTMFRPAKVRFKCDKCGLFLHENDAVHCKHCGIVLNIPSDGDV